jgi:hypothetical protein
VWASLSKFGDETHRTKTDSKGEYRIVGLPRAAGQKIHVEPSDDQPYLPVSLRSPAAKGNDPARLDFTLIRGVLFKGKVTDKSTGKPVRDINVEYFVFGDNPYLEKVPGFRNTRGRPAKSRADGTYTVRGMPGRGLVVATTPRDSASTYLVGVGSERIKASRLRRDDFFTWPYIVSPLRHNTLVEVNPKEDTSEIKCDLKLDPGAEVTGTVVGPDGKPAANVSIEGSWGVNRRDNHSQPNGRFRIPAVNTALPRPFFFHDQKRKLGAVVLFKDNNKLKDVEIKLQPYGVLTGRLLDSDGLPRSKVDLMGYLEDGQLNLKRGWGGIFHADTDKEGKFRAEYLPGVKIGAYIILSPSRIGRKSSRTSPWSQVR